MPDLPFERERELVRSGTELLGRTHSPAAKKQWQDWYQQLSKRDRALYRKGNGPTPRRRT